MNKKQILLDKIIKKVGSRCKLSRALDKEKSYIANLYARDDLLISTNTAYKLRTLFNVSQKSISEANDELMKLKNNRLT